MASPNAIIIEQPAGLTRTSLKHLARIAGVFYLIVGITGGFSEGYVDPKLYVAGDAAARAGNVIANTGLVRVAVIAHLMDAVFFVLTATTLYPGTGPGEWFSLAGRHPCGPCIRFWRNGPK